MLSLPTTNAAIAEPRPTISNKSCDQSITLYALPGLFPCAKNTSPSSRVFHFLIFFTFSEVYRFPFCSMKNNRSYFWYNHSAGSVTRYSKNSPPANLCYAIAVHLLTVGAGRKKRIEKNSSINGAYRTRNLRYWPSASLSQTFQLQSCPRCSQSFKMLMYSQIEVDLILFNM